MEEFVAYYRVSTERHRVSGIGLEAQYKDGAPGDVVYCHKSTEMGNQ